MDDQKKILTQSISTVELERRWREVRARMNITVRPTVGSDRVWVWVCDNYFITESGVSECLHKTPKEIFSV